MTSSTDRSVTPADGLARAGAVAWLAAALLFAVANVVAGLAWSTPYSLVHNNVSDLGNVHCRNTGASNPPVRYICSPLHGFFNVSAIVVAVLVIVGVLLTGRLWGRGVASLAGRVLLVFAAVGYVLAGLWPSDVNLNLHVLGALLLFGAGDLGLIAAGLVSRHSPLGRLRAATLLIAITAMAATWMHFSRHYLGLGMGGTERIAVFALEAWLVVASLHVLTGRVWRASPGK